MDLLADLKKDGLAIVMVTHDESYARRADRMIRMADGLIVSGPGDKQAESSVS